MDGQEIDARINRLLDRLEKPDCTPQDEERIRNRVHFLQGLKEQ